MILTGFADHIPKVDITAYAQDPVRVTSHLYEVVVRVFEVLAALYFNLFYFGLDAVFVYSFHFRIFHLHSSSRPSIRNTHHLENSCPSIVSQTLYCVSPRLTWSFDALHSLILLLAVLSCRLLTEISVSTVVSVKCLLDRSSPAEFQIIIFRKRQFLLAGMYLLPPERKYPSCFFNYQASYILVSGKSGPGRR